jgi:single-strand DNA-binding protein
MAGSGLTPPQRNQVAASTGGRPRGAVPIFLEHAMASVNKVILIGNCGRDPEVRYTPSGTAICNVSVATSSRRKDKASGETIEDTQWHRVTFYDRLAEIAGEYLKKGRAVYIEGRLKYGKYTDKDGIERNTVDIVAEQMQMLGGRDGGGEEGGGGYSRGGAREGGDEGGGERQPPSRPAARPAPAPSPRPAPKAATGFDDMDDDIPF